MATIFEESPFAFVIWDSMNTRYCHFCCRNDRKLQRCTRCKFAHYCDRNCQKAAWKDHSEECNNLKKIYPKMVSDTCSVSLECVIYLKVPLIWPTPTLLRGLARDPKMLLMEEFPYAFVVSTSKKAQVCHHCCSTVSALRRCSGCRFAHYCNDECQRLAWKDHAMECGQLKKVHPKLPTDTARLMARIIAKQRAESEGGSSEPSGEKRTFQTLMSHANEIRSDSLRMEHFTYVCAMLKACVGDEMLPPVSELLDIFGRICINSFSILSSDGAPIGVGLYLDLSILDHSCNPDAVVVFDGPKAILNSIRQGENTKNVGYKTAKISYVELLFPSSERKRRLKEQYYFDCTCARCKDMLQDQIVEALKCPAKGCDSYVLISADEADSATCEKCGTSTSGADTGITMMQRIRWQLEKLNSLQEEQDFSSVYDRATDLLKEAESVLHSVNVYFIRLLDLAFDAAVQLETWPQAVELGEASLPGYRLHLPRGHPSVTYRLAQLGKMLQFLSRLEEAESYLQQAYDEARLSHGDKHPLCDSIAELLFTCREERRVHLAKGQTA